MIKHILSRMSPKGPGIKFVGRCIKCGVEGLTFLDGTPCSSDMSYEESIELVRRLSSAKKISGNKLLNKLEQDAMEVACAAVLVFGEGDSIEQAAAKAGNLWLDHPAYQAAKMMVARFTLKHDHD